MQLDLILMKYTQSFSKPKQDYKSHLQVQQSMRPAKKGHCIQRCENHVIRCVTRRAIACCVLLPGLVELVEVHKRKYCCMLVTHDCELLALL